jgi:hypothetical protein
MSGRATPAGSAAAERSGSADATTRLAIMPCPAAHTDSPGHRRRPTFGTPHPGLRERSCRRWGSSAIPFVNGLLAWSRAGGRGRPCVALARRAPK